MTKVHEEIWSKGDQINNYLLNLRANIEGSVKSKQAPWVALRDAYQCVGQQGHDIMLIETSGKSCKINKVSKSLYAFKEATATSMTFEKQPRNNGPH